MKKNIITAALLVVCMGCTSALMTTTETTDSKNPTQVTKLTKIRIRSFWDAKSDIVKTTAKINQSTSGISVGGIGQETSGSNAVAAAGLLMETAGKLLMAAPK